MVKLSVNINKAATLRNARGGNNPNVIKFALDCENFGADGITVHPRPDQRHITQEDVINLKQVVTKEFNIEGYPSKAFIDLVLRVQPDQVTLVPDEPHVLTSNQGWNVINNKFFLQPIINEFKLNGIRTSIFIDPIVSNIELAKNLNVDRVELYTEQYAKQFLIDKKKAIKPYIECAKLAHDINLDLNAGHDLDLNNLSFFINHIDGLSEVSIGHALICDALYFGLENTIKLYRNQLK